MRVAFISSLNGGVGTYTVELVKALSDSVNKIDLYLFASDPAKKRPNFPKNVNIIAYTNSPLKLMILLFKHFKTLSSVNLVHLNYASFFVPVYLCKKVWGTPYILTSHGMPQPNLEKGFMKVCYFFEKNLLKMTSKCSAHHIAISGYVQRNFMSEYGLESSVVYHGIQRESRLNISSTKRQDVRKKLNIPPDQFVVLYIGSMNRYKNVMTLINAIPIVLSLKKDVTFIVIGKGELQEAAKQKVTDLSVTDQVLFISYAEDLMSYYVAADLFVLPSINEMFGIVLLEAMSYGLPVVASRGGACPEVLGDAGLQFDPQNHQELAENILFLLGEKDLYKDLQKRSLQRVKQFTWDEAAKQYFSIYKKYGRNCK